jgi:transcriptional regulator with XRE-family HTH domain
MKEKTTRAKRTPIAHESWDRTTAAHGAMIKTARERKQLSQAALGQALGVSRQAVSMWEKGRNLHDFRRLHAIYALLGLDRNQMQISLNRLLKTSEPAPLLQWDVQTFFTSPVEGEEDKFYIDAATFASKAPPALRAADLTQCIIVSGNSMMPWRVPGDPVFYDVLRSPRVGSHVLVGFKEPTDERALRATHRTNFALKLLTGIAQDSIRLKQYFPDKEITISSNEILTVYPVWEWTDLYGPFPSI